VPRCLVGTGIGYHWNLSVERTHKQHFSEIVNDGGSVIGGAVVAEARIVAPDRFAAAGVYAIDAARLTWRLDAFHAFL
jgi:hypothetical protein